jgi:hypothetical protein
MLWYFQPISLSMHRLLPFPLWLYYRRSKWVSSYRRIEKRGNRITLHKGICSQSSPPPPLPKCNFKSGEKQDVNSIKIRFIAVPFQIEFPFPRGIATEAGRQGRQAGRRHLLKKKKSSQRGKGGRKKVEVEEVGYWPETRCKYVLLWLQPRATDDSTAASSYSSKEGEVKKWNEQQSVEE